MSATEFQRNASDPSPQASIAHLKLLDEFPALIWHSTAAGECNYVNQAWVNFTARPFQAHLGRGWVDGIYPADREQCLQSFQAAVENGQDLEIEFRLRRNDGEYRWMTGFGRPFRDTSGKLIGYLTLCHDLTERKITNENLRLLTKRMISMQENERLKISHELHDEIGQSLTGLMINLVMLRSDLDAENDVPQQRLEAAIKLVQETIDAIRNLAGDLRPPALDTLGLNLALAGLCQEVARRYQLSIQYSGAETPTLSDDVCITLYRFLQEGLSNVFHHADASQVEVRLEHDRRMIRLKIADDGKGMENPADFLHLSALAAGKADAHFGLLGMKERFELLGGRLEVQSQLGKGTILTGELPISTSQTDL